MPQALVPPRLKRPETDEATFRREFASLTTGSGAVAMILARADLAPDGHRFRGTFTRAATEHNRLCLGQVDRGVTDTKGLLMAGIELSQRTWSLAQQVLGFSEADVEGLHAAGELHANYELDAIRALKALLSR